MIKKQIQEEKFHHHPAGMYLPQVTSIISIN